MTRPPRRQEEMTMHDFTGLLRRQAPDSTLYFRTGGWDLSRGLGGQFILLGYRSQRLFLSLASRRSLVGNRFGGTPVGCNGVASTMDWSFASGYSPPRLSTTQLPSTTDRLVSLSDRHLHPIVGAHFQAHVFGVFAADHQPTNSRVRKQIEDNLLNTDVLGFTATRDCQGRFSSSD